MSRSLLSASCVWLLASACSTPPTAEITGPDSDDRLPSTVLTVFAGVVVDPADEEESDRVALWTSSVDGDLGESELDFAGTVALSVWGLTPGEHSITLEFTNAVGLSDSHTVVYTVNHPPTAPVVAVTPDRPTAADDFRGEMVEPSTDVEGDPLTYGQGWSRNGADSGIAGNTMPGRSTRRGEEWMFYMRAFDGYDWGPRSDTGTVRIVNAPPGAPEIVLLPEVPVIGIDDLACVVVGAAADSDGDPVSYAVSWTADGRDYPSDVEGSTGPRTNALEGDTVPAQDLGLAETFTCTIVASDGMDDSPPVSVSARPTAP